ncbi:unnamed protein product [Sphenostylis stenocarpa]|uniref:Uncharacterized protein n=1 Tax=Sphenostylis stenocarpa TaxID=92480 RepID=A0AA87BDA1_9FABA|nr:unnamed protein product [Sphenostylis stenocarpa]
MRETVGGGNEHKWLTVRECGPISNGSWLERSGDRERLQGKGCGERVSYILVGVSYDGCGEVERVVCGVKAKRGGCGDLGRCRV